MKTSRSITLVTLCCWAFLLSTVIAPGAVRAATWQATAGTERTDHGIQALAFLPNELWIHVGDSITWTFPTPEIHTVTFLQQSFLANPQSRFDRLARVLEAAVLPQIRQRHPMALALMVQPA